MNSLNRFVKQALFVTAMVAVSVALGDSSSHAATKSQASDIFDGDVWHAVNGSWPGSITFDGKSKKVVLAPMGSAPITATYAYTVIPAQAAGPKRKSVKRAVQLGTLTMTNEKGQVSKADFKLENSKILTLNFTGVSAEHYLRMNPAEEQAEIKRIKQMVAQGKIPVR